MYQVMKMSNKFYAVNVSSLDEEEQIERIEEFINEGTPIICCDDLDNLEDFGIPVDEIEIVILD